MTENRALIMISVLAGLALALILFYTGRQAYHTREARHRFRRDHHCVLTRVDDPEMTEAYTCDGVVYIWRVDR